LRGQKKLTDFIVVDRGPREARWGAARCFEPGLNASCVYEASRNVYSCAPIPPRLGRDEWRCFLENSIMYQPIEHWISLDRDASPTTASTNMYNALLAAGAKPVNLGQGREIVELPLLQKLTIEAFEQAIKGGKLLNSKYGAPSAELNAASAAWLKRIMNVDVTKETTFTLENQGRGGLYAAFHLLASLAGFRNDGRIIVPDTSWPMVSDQLNDFQLKPALYTMARGRYADHIRAQLGAHGDAIVGLYVNSPHNPTGSLLTKSDFEQIFDVLNAANSGAVLERRGGRKIGLVMDNPYPHAAPEITRGGQRGLDTGLDSFRQDQPTPWIMPVSASKFFGTAEPGFTMLATHAAYAKPVAARLMRSIGIGFFAPYFRALTATLQAENDTFVLDHFAMLRAKYTANRAALKDALGASVVDGDPGMTALVTIDPRDFERRLLPGRDGRHFTIDDLNDAIEYLANRYGVITVNNGMDSGGRALLRLAAAEEPANYRRGIQSLAAGFDEIRAAPRRNEPIEVRAALE
jgi:aspartate/methionine/tyrosine aminotransferase